MPIAGVCPACDASLRKVPVLKGRPTQATEELIRAGEMLSASRMETGAEVGEVLVCDACRTWRLSARNPVTRCRLDLVRDRQVSRDATMASI